MLHHNIKKNEEADNMRNQCCRVCDTTEEHDCCVDEMIKSSSKKGFNTLSAVFDKSSNTLTRISAGLGGRPDILDGMNKAKEFRNIVMTHVDKDTKHVLVKSNMRNNNRLESC